MWSNGWEENYTARSVGENNDVLEIKDTSITDKYSKFRDINANLGLLWNLYNSLTIGFVIKMPFDASIHHEFNYIQTSTYGLPINMTLPGTPRRISEDVKLRMPLSYGIGLAWRVSDALSFDIDVYQTRWSDYILIDS